MYYYKSWCEDLIYNKSKCNNTNSAFAKIPGIMYSVYVQLSDVTLSTLKDNWSINNLTEIYKITKYTIFVHNNHNNWRGA